MRQRNPIQQIARFQEMISTVGAASFLTAPPMSSLAPGERSPQRLLKVPEHGWIVALLPGATVAGGTVDDYRNASALLSVRVKLAGRDLFTDGNSGSFVPVQRFLEARQRFNFIRRVMKEQSILIEAQNDSAALTITPSLLFSFIADRQVAEIAAAAEIIG